MKKFFKKSHFENNGRKNGVDQVRQAEVLLDSGELNNKDARKGVGGTFTECTGCGSS